jgi:hypothetical protein
MTAGKERGSGKAAAEKSEAVSGLDPQAVVRRAEELIAQQRARAKLALDFAGWYSHGDAPVWTLGYYEGSAFCTVPGLSKSALTTQWVPRLHRRGITPYVTRPGMQSWVKALPNAY